MTIQVKDANGSTKYMQTNGSGTSGDPYRVVHDVNSVALPTGASTAANQTTTNSKLDTLHTDIGTTLHADIATTIHGDLTAAQPAGENHIGEVGANAMALLTVTPTLDTSAYTGGDVLFATTSIGNAARANDKGFVIKQISVVDKGDQAAADIELFFFRTNVTSGAFNSAPAISDSDSANILGYCKIASTDFKDLGDNKIASVTVNIACVPTSGARTLYMFGLTGGTPTYGASDLVFNFVIEQH